MSGHSVIVAMRATTGRLSLSTTGRAVMPRQGECMVFGMQAASRGGVLAMRCHFTPRGAQCKFTKRYTLRAIGDATRCRTDT